MHIGLLMVLLMKQKGMGNLKDSDKWKILYITAVCGRYIVVVKDWFIHNEYIIFQMQV